MKIVLIYLIFSFQNLHAKEFINIFPKAKTFIIKQISDPISTKPINTTVTVAKDINNKVVGYIREINTTTGCNSECLPVIFTLFFNGKLNFIKLYSKPGLTKLGHEPFSNEDYFKLDRIILKNPKSFSSITHPLDMIDGFSGATKLEFKNDVIENAAFTSLRVNLYFQQTLKELKKMSDNEKVLIP